MNTEYESAIFLQFSKWLSKQEYYSIRTKRPYLRIVKSFLNYLGHFNVPALKDVDKGLLHNFMTKKGDTKYAASYVRLRESALDLFFAWANKHKHNQNNPVINYRKAKLHLKPFPKKTDEISSQTITILTKDEQQRLLDTISNATDNFILTRNRCIIMLILDSAIYAEELINLLADDIDLENVCINVLSRQNKERQINISRQTQLYCKEWLVAREGILQNDELSALFITESLGPITKRYLHKIVSNIMYNAGINKDHFGPEILRQTAIYNMFRNGLSLEEVQKLTGIGTLAILKKYLDHTETKEAKNPTKNIV